jgi:phage gp45-like
MVGTDRGSVAEWAGDVVVVVVSGQVMDLSVICRPGNAQAGCTDVVHADGCSIRLSRGHQATSIHHPFPRQG